MRQLILASMLPTLCCSLAWLCGCAETSNNDIATTAQEVRAGNGTRGQVYLGVDLLVTDAQQQAIACGQGDLQVTFETSRNGLEGPWVVADQQDIRLTCNQGRGDLALVVDNSGSLTRQLALVQQGANAVADKIINSGGRMSLVRVSTNASVVSPLTSSLSHLSAAVAELDVNHGWTALWDGVRIANDTLGADAAVAARAAQPSVTEFCANARKRAIVVFTDGRENNSANQKLWSSTYPGDGIDTQLADLQSLRVAGVTTPIYAVGLGNNVDADALRQLADSTGGRFIGVKTAEQIPGVLEMLAEYFAATQRVCTELPSHQCGPLDVRVTYRYRVNGTETSATKIEHLNVPCEARVSGRIATILLTLEETETERATIDTLLANTVNYVSPTDSPRVLFVRDDFHHGEYASDTALLHQRLVEAGYATALLDEPANGLTDAAVADYDVVWFSNPGYPMDDPASIDVLRKFSSTGGGVVLQGDDMTWFYDSATSVSDLTRLVPKDNGVQYCGVAIDNGRGGRYRVTLEASDHPIVRGIENATFLYGDDIDTSSVLDPSTTVLAWATVEGAKNCKRKPVITAYTPVSAK